MDEMDDAHLNGRRWRMDDEMDVFALLRRSCLAHFRRFRRGAESVGPADRGYGFILKDTWRTGVMDLDHVDPVLGLRRFLHTDIISIGAFLPLRPGIRRYRLTVRCRKAVYLARFLQCRDVMHLRVCSRGLRASVDPNATDFDWLVRICPEENVRRH